MAGKKPDYSVSVSHENGGKNHYTTVGAGWNVAKGGISIKLQALPIDGKLVLFPYAGNPKTDHYGGIG